jgi:predicted small lipoprotein YifL
MRATFQAIAIAALLMTLTACSKQPPTTNADSAQPKNAPAADAAAKAVPDAGKTGSEPEKPRPASIAAKPEPDVVQETVKPEPKVTVPAGTKLRVALLDAVSSDKSQAGDQFMASLTEPIVVNGKTVLAKGTRVRGRVVEATESGRVKGRASLELTLIEIVRDGGKTITISTRPYTAVAESTKKRDAEIVGGAAGVGAAIGAIAGGGKGAAIGAAVGGGAGTGTVLATKGKDIRYGPEHVITFSLANPIEL